MATATASQTIGPFWHLLEDRTWSDLTRFGAAGERIRLIGSLTDGDGMPVTDACVEIWQSDPPADDTFEGFGRCATDGEGNFHFTTLKPGPVPGRGNAQQAPHVAITILARGLLKALATRAYFEGEALNDSDPLLAAVADPGRRGTLIAKRVDDATWRLDIRLQGDGETVFLEL
jgi:protocatechuate 3,4-dioxygenase alpha subunit